LEGGGYAEAEDLTLLKGSIRVHMEVKAAQTDVPEATLTLARDIGVGKVGGIIHRQRNENPVESSSFQQRGH
jgi:hypothetical protein